MTIGLIITFGTIIGLLVFGNGLAYMYGKRVGRREIVDQWEQIERERNGE